MGRLLAGRSVCDDGGRRGATPGGCPASSEGGFTLVELMIVLAIVGILVSLAEPSFQRSILRAREAALTQSLYTIRDVIDQYRADRGAYPEGLATLVEARYLRRVPADPFTRSETTWQEILDEEEGGLFDVHSGSDLVSVDGTPYNEW